MEELRIILYPLGFLSGIAFASRFIIQWALSEKKGESIVPPIFWQISLFANILSATHSFIQVQYHICIIQVCNAVISWRNLNLLQQKEPYFTWKGVSGIMAAFVALTTLAFILQSHENWIRVPTAPWQNGPTLSVGYLWHSIGIIGYVLFSVRFWLQWWFAEKKHISYLPESFWWISLAGAFLSLAYAMHIHDLVNILGPLAGIIPYARNLVLLKKSRQPT